VLTRKADHWSQRISTDNPRGYTDKQFQRIAAAPTAAKKRRVELNVMYTRRQVEELLKTPIVDEYGLDCIAVMEADIEVQYAALMEPVAGSESPDHHVTADNPHGFLASTLARLNAIEDPVERAKEEDRLLKKRRANDKIEGGDESRARKRAYDVERRKKAKINAG
jgi:hypothetical protein